MTYSTLWDLRKITPEQHGKERYGSGPPGVRRTKPSALTTANAKTGRWDSGDVKSEQRHGRRWRKKLSRAERAVEQMGRGPTPSC